MFKYSAKPKQSCDCLPIGLITKIIEIHIHRNSLPMQYTQSCRACNTTEKLVL